MPWELGASTYPAGTRNGYRQKNSDIAGPRVDPPRVYALVFAIVIITDWSRCRGIPIAVEKWNIRTLSVSQTYPPHVKAQIEKEDANATSFKSLDQTEGRKRPDPPCSVA
jgi:hypothetical protein